MKYCLASLLFIVGTINTFGRPANVILFLVDDMGWMDSTAYGSEYYETPNMDRLAKQSMRFTDAYAVPLCSPTRATILSGQYSARHGVTSASGHKPPQPVGASLMPEKGSPNRKFIYPESKNYLDPKLTTIAEVLQQAGYRTGHFGKWHLGATPDFWPDKHGFETTWFCTPDPGPPSYFSPYGVKREGDPAGPTKIGNITDGPQGEYITDRLTDEALKFIEQHKNEPFYLNLCQYAVHGPWGHKEEYTQEFADKAKGKNKQRNPIMASMLRSVDDSLGRILNRLDELGLTKKTLFIFYSDNGGNTHSNVPGSRQMKVSPKHPKYAFVQDWKKWAGPLPPTNNDPLREGKGRIYEGGQRVPLMVRWPGRIKPATTTDAVVTAVDIYPTILDALGIPKPKEHILDGLSMLPVLEQRARLERKAVFTWFPHLIPAVSVRSGDYKLIRRWEAHPQYPELLELYNLKDDIGETKNLASQMPAKVEQLEALIDGFIKNTGALTPKANPAYQPIAGTQNADPARGLVPKFSRISIVKGALRVEADGRSPFLGTGQAKFSGPINARVRVRSTAGGPGKFIWKTAAQENFPASGQAVPFTVPAGNAWTDIQVTLPVNGKVSIIRTYLPAAASPVEVQFLEFSPPGERSRSWTFAATQP